MKSTKRLVGFAIFAFWLLMTAFLLHRELGVRTLEPGEMVAASQAPREAWMGVYIASEEAPGGERRVGQIHIASAPEARQGLKGSRLALDIGVHLNLLGKATELSMEGTVWRPLEVPRAEFDFAVRSADYAFQVEGRVGDGELRGTVMSAGETLPLQLPIDNEVLFGNGLGSALSFPTLEVGEEYRMESFDPLTLSEGQARVRCVAREILELPEGPVETLRLEVETGGFESLAWVDEQGDLVRAETPIGLVIERLPGPPAQVAFDGEADGEAGEELLGLTAIRPQGLRPFRGARSLTMVLSGLAGLELPEDRVQQSLGEGRYRVEVPPEPLAVQMAQVPGAPRAEGALDDFLSSDPFIQSDHPKIRRQAEEILGAETDPWRRARLLHDWVFTRLDKEAVMSVPSALEVLVERRGDCNEHAVLYTALARAAGLPTRIAIGVVWSDELDGFYYHAWPEVLFEEGWVWLDPTLGQPRADATHLKLLNGGIESWPQLLPYLGRLEVEVLEIE